MKISVYSLIFKEYSLESFFKVIGKLGYKAAEVRVHEDGVHLSPYASIEEADRVRKLAGDYGLKVCCLASYAKLGYPWERAKEELDKMVKIGVLADRVNAGVFRIKIAGYNPELGYENIRRLFREQAEELFKRLQRAGVESIPVIEQHGGGDLAHSAGILKDFLRGLDPERIGVLFDPGNAVREGWLPIELQIDMVKEYIKHVHVKNYKWNPEKPGEVIPSPLNNGIVDWVKIVHLLKKLNYQGYYSLEDFRPIPPERRAKEALEFFKRVL
ncbi:MAG: hypothetical protein DRJ51_02245 [Thermoprotei archaeon]|nr:MAG: hypothetical protein DRJ51_02245 [Thermoprotei archaeon]RLF03439.1 MAG: hypothetical protein DRJ59_00660 [Thermoprotei archaeon]